jgi:hypothetical protein
MNFPFKIFRRPEGSSQSQGLSKRPLKASWSRDPKSGRLSQSWRSSDDGERSCTRRPSRPPAFRLTAWGPRTSLLGPDGP